MKTLKETLELKKMLILEKILALKKKASLKKTVRYFVTKLYRIRIYNEEVLNSDSKLIICPNHSRFMDGVIMWSFAGKNDWIVAKSELFRCKIIRDFLTKRKVISINRKGNALTEVDNIVNAMSDVSGNLIIFPQGTRSDDLNGFKRGPVEIAQRTNAELVPAYITEKYRLFEDVDIAFSNRIAITNEDKEKLRARQLRVQYTDMIAAAVEQKKLELSSIKAQEVERNQLSRMTKPKNNPKKRLLTIR